MASVPPPGAQSDAGDDDSFGAALSATTKNLGKTVEIRIRDNGTGIPLEVKEKIQLLLHHQTGRRRQRARPFNEPRHYRETAWWQD